MVPWPRLAGRAKPWTTLLARAHLLKLAPQDGQPVLTCLGSSCWLHRPHREIVTRYRARRGIVTVMSTAKTRSHRRLHTQTLETGFIVAPWKMAIPRMTPPVTPVANRRPNTQELPLVISRVWTSCCSDAPSDDGM